MVPHAFLYLCLCQKTVEGVADKLLVLIPVRELFAGEHELLCIDVVPWTSKQEELVSLRVGEVEFVHVDGQDGLALDRVPFTQVIVCFELEDLIVLGWNKLFLER